jgi:hypothetical protein
MPGPRSPSQKRAARKWGDARSSLMEEKVELSVRELRQRVAEGHHVLAVAGDSSELAYDGFPVDIWPVSVKEENYRPHASHIKIENPDDWYKVLESRGWRPYRSARIPQFIFSVQFGPALPEIEPLRKYPFNPTNPRCSLKFHVRRRRHG